jgi:hypothetical protein
VNGYDTGHGDTYELDPADGRVRSILRGTTTEGLAIDGDKLWYASVISAGRQKLVQIDRAGSVLREVPVTAAVVNDLAIIGSYAYYISNSDTDPIVEVTLANGRERKVIEPAVRGRAPYSLGYDGRALIVADKDPNGNFLLRIDPRSGLILAEIRLAIPGWITALAFDEGFAWEWPRGPGTTVGRP